MKKEDLQKEVLKLLHEINCETFNTAYSVNNVSLIYGISPPLMKLNNYLDDVQKKISILIDKSFDDEKDKT